MLTESVENLDCVRDAAIVFAEAGLNSVVFGVTRVEIVGKYRSGQVKVAGQLQALNSGMVWPRAIHSLPIEVGFRFRIFAPHRLHVGFIWLRWHRIIDGFAGGSCKLTLPDTCPMDSGDSCRRSIDRVVVVASSHLRFDQTVSPGSELPFPVGPPPYVCFSQSCHIALYVTRPSRFRSRFLTINCSRESFGLRTPRISLYSSSPTLFPRD